MVSLPQISKGIATFIENELIVHGNGKQKFVMYFLIPQIPHKVEQLYNDYKDNMFVNDFIKPEGIDIEELYRTSKEAMSKSGNIDLFGIILNEQDVDKLYGYITRSVV